MRADVRFITPTLDASKRHFYSDLGFQFACRFQELGVCFKLVSSTLSVIEFENGQTTRWARFQSEWTAEFDTFTTNIVCGPPDELQRAWTAGMRNIAIAHAYARPWDGRDAQALDSYDDVWVFSKKRANELAALRPNPVARILTARYDSREEIANALAIRTK